VRRTRVELMKDIDAEYYGYMDDDDGLILPLEQAEEKIAISRTVADWKSSKESGGVTEAEVEDIDIYHIEHVESDDEDTSQSSSKRQLLEADIPNLSQYISHVPVPSQREVEDVLVRRKKQELLDKYVSDSLIHQSVEAKALMGFNPSTS